ncbi:MAG: TPR end-of-group domain-containing protein [Pyrinomonadaceae bacterium]
MKRCPECGRNQNYIQSYSFALIYIGLGNKDEAVKWLEKEVTGHSEVANSFAVAQELNDVRDDPRFKDLLKRMNLPV